MAVTDPAGCVVTQTNLRRSLAEELAKVLTMRQVGGSAETRVQTLIPNLGSVLVHNPHAGVFYRTM